jgi:hypothetical protein
MRTATEIVSLYVDKKLTASLKLQSAIREAVVELNRRLPRQRRIQFVIKPVLVAQFAPQRTYCQQR